MSEKMEDLVGQQFGKLRVISFNGRSGRSTLWNCICECGTEKTAASHNLKNKSTKSCGCILKEIMKGRTGIGDSEFKMSPEIMKDIRKIVFENRKLSQKDQSEIIHKKYPQFAMKTIPSYINGVSTSERVFQMYLNKTISLGVLKTLGICENENLGDFLADEFIERKMTIGELELARALMKKKEVKSWDEAIKTAMGKIVHEIKPPSEKRSRGYVGTNGPQASEAPKTFEDLLNEIVFMGTNWRFKVQMAIDMAPFVPDKGRYNFTVFNKIYMLRHTLKENFEFVDKKVKEYLDAMVSKGNVAQGDISNAEFTAKESSDETSGGSGNDHGGRETGGSTAEAVPEGNGQAVPADQPRVISVEGRVR